MWTQTQACLNSKASVFSTKMLTDFCSETGFVSLALIWGFLLLFVCLLVFEETGKWNSSPLLALTLLSSISALNFSLLASHLPPPPPSHSFLRAPSKYLIEMPDLGLLETLAYW